MLIDKPLILSNTNKIKNKPDKFAVFRDKPFWIWSKSEHTRTWYTTKGQCCFNHIVGLPTRKGKSCPIFEFQKDIIDAVECYKLVWIKKARGLGVSELMIRYMLYLALKDHSLKGHQMAIITGPRLELAVDLMKRMKTIISKFYTSDEKETQLEINDVTIRAYPSNAKSYRGQDKMAMLFLDEADFFDSSDAIEARAAAEGYLLKSNPIIVMCSTPNQPGGFFDLMEHEPHLIYHKLFLPYTIGMSHIYDESDLAIARQSPSFEREYNLQYSTTEGNIYPHYLVDKCVSEYPLELKDGLKVLGVDPAFGSSRFAIVGVEKIDGLIYVKEAKEYERPSPSAMLELVTRLAHSYENVIVDSAHPGLVTDLLLRDINVNTIKFNQSLNEMVMLTSELVKKHTVFIHPAYTGLITQLKAVVFDKKGHPDKTKLSFDIGDAWNMAVYWVNSLAFHYSHLPSF